MRKFLRHLTPVVLLVVGFLLAVNFRHSTILYNLAGACAACAGCLWANMVTPHIIAVVKYAALHPLPPKVRR